MGHRAGEGPIPRRAMAPDREAWKELLPDNRPTRSSRIRAELVDARHPKRQKSKRPAARRPPRRTDSGEQTHHEEKSRNHPGRQG